MTDKKTTLKVLLYEHNSEANALLRADYYSLGPALERYLKFIDSEPLIKSFVDDCVQNHLPDGFDAASEVDEVKGNFGAIFSFPPDFKGECAVVYLVLKNIVARDLSCCDSILYPYGSGSKKFNDMTSGFLESVARRLINGVVRAITVEAIRNGMDANVTQINNFNNTGAAIAAQTADNASTTINQTNGMGREELDGIFSALEDSLLELTAANRETASDAIEALKDALAEQSPKPSIVKSLWSTVKGINDGATFAKNVAALGGFIAVNYPGLIS